MTDREWQPIETVPTNKSVLIFIPNTEHYGDGIWRAIRVDMGAGKRWHMASPSRGQDLHPAHCPTHWMPLPDPPK